MLPVLEEASSRPLTTVAQDVVYCRDKLADLDKVAQKDAFLKGELKVVTDLSVGLNLSIRPMYIYLEQGRSTHPLIATV